MIITISGYPGAGKTTVAKIVAERLGYNFYSIGDLRGKMALEKGMTIEELNKLGENEAFTDNDVDEYQKKLGKKEDNFVIDGKLSYYFIPYSLKVFLDVNKKVGAERILKDKREDERRASSVEERERRSQERVLSDKKRYKKYYGINDFDDRRNFDLVIDTTKISAEEVADKIVEYAKNYG